MPYQALLIFKICPDSIRFSQTLQDPLSNDPLLLQVISELPDPIFFLTDSLRFLKTHSKPLRPL